MGIGSLDATSGAIGVVIEDRFGSLLAKSNWKKTTAKDWYVPSFSALMDDSYPIEGKFVPLVGDVLSAPLSTTEDMAKAVFVPFPLMRLMFVRPKEGEDQEIGDEESIYPSADYKIPKNLLTRLIEGLWKTSRSLMAETEMQMCPPRASAPPAVSGHICNSRIAKLTTPKPGKKRMRIKVKDLVEAQILISTSLQTCRYEPPRSPHRC